jgi:hypothetical protein
MDTRSPPKSDKSFWILLVAVIVIVIILIVVSLKCNKPCKCHNKSCKGKCVTEDEQCNFDKDCLYRGERCVGPSNQNYTPPGNCKLSNAQCKTDGECLKNMYCADPSDNKKPVPLGKQGVCYDKTLCKYELSQAADPCFPNECNVDVGSSLSPTATVTATATAGSGSGTWILKGASTNSKPANGSYTVNGTSPTLTVTFTVSDPGSGFFPNDIAVATLPKNLNLKVTDTKSVLPTFTTPPTFTLLKPSKVARGYCEFPKPQAQLNSQSHTLRGASHSSY